MQATDELRYLLQFADYDTECYVANVINDCDEDPEFSAVTANNRIKCLIKVWQEVDSNCPYTDVPAYFEASGFSQQAYETFERKRKKEQQYYIGKQY